MKVPVGSYIPRKNYIDISFFSVALSDTPIKTEIKCQISVLQMIPE